MKARKINILLVLAACFWSHSAHSVEPPVIPPVGQESIQFCDQPRDVVPVWRTHQKHWAKLRLEIGENGLDWEDDGSTFGSLEIVVRSCGLGLRIQQRLGLVEAHTRVAKIRFKETRVIDAFSLTHDRGVNVQINFQTDHTLLEAPQLRLDKIQLSQECIEWRDDASLISGNLAATLNCESRTRFVGTHWVGKPQWRLGGNFVHMETEKNQFSSGRVVLLDASVLHGDLKSSEDVWEGVELVQADGATALSLHYERGRILAGGLEFIGPAEDLAEQGMYYHPKSKWISQILGDLRLGKQVATKMQDHHLPQGLELSFMYWLQPAVASSTFLIRHWRGPVELDHVGLGAAVVDWDGLPQGIHGRNVEWSGRVDQWPEKWKVSQPEWRCEECSGIPKPLMKPATKPLPK